MRGTAGSPGLAMSSLSNAAVMVRASRRFDDGQRLARIDGFAVLHGKAPQPSCHVGRDFAELLHHLDQADHIAHGHGVAFGLEWRSEERRVGKECRSRWSPYH